MKLSSNSIVDGQPIPAEFAFCVPAAEDHVRWGRIAIPTWPGPSSPLAPDPWCSSVTTRTCPAAATT